MSAARSFPPAPLPAPRPITDYPKTQQARVAATRAMIERGEAGWVYAFTFRTEGEYGSEYVKRAMSEDEARAMMQSALDRAGMSATGFTLVGVENTNHYQARSGGSPR